MISSVACVLLASGERRRELRTFFIYLFDKCLIFIYLAIYLFTYRLLFIYFRPV